MANVFTKKYHKPRTTTLRDFEGHVAVKTLTFPEIRSPTRVDNPHPQGLIYEQHEGKSRSLWNPRLHRNSQPLSVMTNHIRWVNFSCGPVVLSPKQSGQPDIPPVINYTENTTSRISYRDPRTYPHLQANMRTTRYGYKPQTKPARGIGDTPSFQLWKGLERLSFPEFPAGNSGKDDLSKYFQNWNDVPNVQL